MVATVLDVALRQDTCCPVNSASMKNRLSFERLPTRGTSPILAGENVRCCLTGIYEKISSAHNIAKQAALHRYGLLEIKDTSLYNSEEGLHHITPYPGTVEEINAAETGCGFPPDDVQYQDFPIAIRHKLAAR